MQQYNIKTLPDNLAAAIKIINEAIRRSQERDDSPASSADGKKLQTAMESLIAIGSQVQ